uniref:Uncharacterized protein n=1 Tax=Anguilla anguilla TaxID=7936 RepID=A0A0E9S2D4_ANGAN
MHFLAPIRLPEQVSVQVVVVKKKRCLTDVPRDQGADHNHRDDDGTI